ncbi:tRNA pseudouridine(38-40) synthase TruA [bacterium]|nr:tRNA pseudouridine(38-40) synthase TruA [bacterium]
MRLKAVIEYLGTNYYGWQVQPDKVTIQGTIEKALLQITCNDIRITGAGRTDAGVHALGQVASFDYTGHLDTYRLRYALNSILDRDIFFRSIEETNPTFDARRDAFSKLYRYRIIRGRSPLRRNTAWEYHFSLNVEKMREAAALLQGTHDYAAFCEAEDPRTSLKVDSIDVSEKFDEVEIDVRARGFLYKMVRRIVGVILDCGRGRIVLETIPKLFSRSKPCQIITAPANGLALIGVDYTQVSEDNNLRAHAMKEY